MEVCLFPFHRLRQHWKLALYLQGFLVDLGQLVALAEVQDLVPVQNSTQLLRAEAA